eukprot:553512_1
MSTKDRIALFERLSKKKERKDTQKVTAKRHSQSDLWENQFEKTQPELIDGPPKVTQIWKPVNDTKSRSTSPTPTPGRIKHAFDGKLSDLPIHMLPRVRIRKTNNTETKPLVSNIISQVKEVEFDARFNQNGYFILSDDKKTATFAKVGLPGVHDYQRYPACRVSQPIDTSDILTQSITFKLFQYGWFGIGSDSVVPHGFPGYTDSGWMIRVSNGGSWYNDVGNAFGHHPLANLTNERVTMEYNPDTKQLTVITRTGQRNLYTHEHMPPSGKAYFVFTMASGKVQIFDNEREEEVTVTRTENPQRFRFDIYEKDRFSVTQDGTIATGCGQGCCYSVITTSVVFNQGVHRWKIKFMDTQHRHTNPGIITDVHNLSGIQRSWVSLKNAQGSKACGLLYMWHDYDGKLQGWNNGMLIKDEGNISPIAVDDVVTVVLDCDHWTITFYRNDVLVGTMDIPPGQCYHPCLYTCDCHQQQYQLIN